MKACSALLLFLFASAASAQIDDRLFADYVNSVVKCCPNRGVVVFYTDTEPFVFSKYLEKLQPDRDVTVVSLDGSSLGSQASIKPHLTRGTVAVAYDLGPDAIRILSHVADDSGAITISTTEEDVYATSFSFDSRLPDRFQSPKTPAGCDFKKCGLTFHSEEVEARAMERRAIKRFLNAHGKLETLRKERTATTRKEASLLLKNPRERASLVEIAHLLQDALRIETKPEERRDRRLKFETYVSQDRVLNGEWHDLYAPHHDLSEVFTYFANCEAAEIEWTTSSTQLKNIAPAVVQELEKIRKQICG